MAELADLLAGYEAGLVDGGFVDHGGLLTAVTRQLQAGELTWPGERLLLVPDNLEPGKPEGQLLDLLPAVMVQGLKPAKPSDTGTLTDLERLAWMDAPTDAPLPARDGTLEILGCAGEVNEIRLALRQCLSKRSPLDTVEILYTDRATYLPLLFEVLSRHFGIETGDLDSLPATFSEGIPVRYSRPGRALGAWALWAMEGYPVQGLAGMIREGLLYLSGVSGQDVRAQAADLLTGPAAGTGTGGNLEALRSSLISREKSLIDRLPDSGARYDENGEERSRQLTDEPVLQALAGLLETLQGCTPGPDDALPAVLGAALTFLDKAARTAGELDEYAKTALVQDISDASRLIDELDHTPGGEPFGWITSLIGQVRVAGSGPRPGRIHAAPLSDGGHSGRSHTMVVGLDDGRFPGSDRQEPVLLDIEREGLSELLRLSGEDLSRRERLLGELAARTTGTLTLTCSLRDLTEDRETWPAAPLVKAFRILKDPQAGQEELLTHLSPPAGFIDPGSDSTLDAAEWWTGRFTAPESIPDAMYAFTGRFPHLVGGLAAVTGRRSEALTPWDGLVGSLPPELDILSESGPSVSANRLQSLGACPLRYFFRYILDIERVDEEPPQPGQWLTPADRGSVLHDLFHIYMARLIKGGSTPDFERDSGEIEEILDGLLVEHEKTAPSPSSHVRDYERAVMAESARIFLREEELFTAEHEPLYAEASIGLPPTDWPTELDHLEPVVVTLDAGRRIRVRGRIDRIDQRRSDGRFVITDYKSGGSRWYTHKDRFHEGRLVQHLLYILMVEARLKETLALPPQVAAFRFLFPTSSAQGESVLLTSEELTDRMDVLHDLCDLAGSGCFTPTDEPDDCRWCDYSLICGDTAFQAKGVAAKLEGNDGRLDPLRKLRGYT
jgi:ATP-dependent helicase/nuclease subunit B